MATNSFFSQYNFQSEQQLVDDLIVEAIKIHGVDVVYLARTLGNVDQVMNEDRIPIFDRAYEVEMYVRDFMGFQGEGDFMSRFGLQIRDQVTLSVAIRSFERHVTAYDQTILRPREGDLIYFPFNKKFFEIAFNEHESIFYQTGTLQVYDLKCELFEYSNERFQTGIPAIDNHFEAYDTSEIDNLEDLFELDPIAKNIIYEQKSDEFIDFSEINPFEEVITYPEND